MSVARFLNKAEAWSVCRSYQKYPLLKDWRFSSCVPSAPLTLEAKRVSLQMIDLAERTIHNLSKGSLISNIFLICKWSCLRTKNCQKSVKTIFYYLNQSEKVVWSQKNSKSSVVFNFFCLLRLSFADFLVFVPFLRCFRFLFRCFFWRPLLKA